LELLKHLRNFVVVTTVILSVVSPTMAAQAQIVKDALTSADWMSKALLSSGYKADFSLNSLKEVDRFFDEQSQSGNVKPNGLLSEHIGQRIFGLGSYVGEVIRRHYGGEWRGDNYGPESEMNISIKLISGATIWPVQRTMKRFKNGPEDGIYVYGYLVGKGK